MHNTLDTTTTYYFLLLAGDVVLDNGKGSISIYGETFKDENLDTKHTLAGFVSMANNGTYLII